MEAFFAYAYSFVALINVVSYFPQIAALIKTRTRSVNVSLSSWAMWALGYVLSLGYGVFVLNDMKFALVSGISLVMVLAVSALLVHNIHFRFRDAEDVVEADANTMALFQDEEPAPVRGMSFLIENPKAMYLQLLTGVKPRRFVKMRNRIKND